MKLEIKAFNIIYEDWGDEIDDFFLSCQVDIGIEEKIGSEIYSLDVISPKRLVKLVAGSSIEVGKGYFITSDYNQNTVIKTIERLIDKEISDADRNGIFDDISVYFRSKI